LNPEQQQQQQQRCAEGLGGILSMGGVQGDVRSASCTDHRTTNTAAAAAAAAPEVVLGSVTMGEASVVGCSLPSSPEPSHMQSQPQSWQDVAAIADATAVVHAASETAAGLV
jgi:hypothetical protein